MSRFGDLVDISSPVLLDFFVDWSESCAEMNAVLRDVAAAVGDKGKVIKINADKNGKLVNALKVNGLPTLIIYKNGAVVWRKSGQQDANTLIALMRQYA